MYLCRYVKNTERQTFDATKIDSMTDRQTNKRMDGQTDRQTKLQFTGIPPVAVEL